MSENEQTFQVGHWGRSGSGVGWQARMVLITVCFSPETLFGPQPNRAESAPPPVAVVRMRRSDGQSERCCRQLAAVAGGGVWRWSLVGHPPRSGASSASAAGLLLPGVRRRVPGVAGPRGCRRGCIRQMAHCCVSQQGPFWEGTGNSSPGTGSSGFWCWIPARVQ